MSVDDFHALELLTRAFPGEAWALTKEELMIGHRPSKADDYRRRLKAGRDKHPPGEGQAKKEGMLTTAQKMKALNCFADRLLSGSVPVADRLIHLRHHADELKLTIRDNEIQRKLWESRRRLSEAVEMYAPGFAAALQSEPWAWDGIILAGDTTLICALPKLGKTTLLIDGIGRWHRGEREHLGRQFHGPCPPVIVAGTDMPLRRWMLMFARFGLAEQLPDDRYLLPPSGPIKGLFTQESPIHLDSDGIGRLAELASKMPGAIIIVDSYSKLTAPLGLKEAGSEFAGPLGDLQEALAPYSCTLVVIHHSGHARAGEGAVAASRGTSALPAAVSQIVALSWLNKSRGSNDKRVVLQTEGRGGEPLQLLIEQQEGGWISHGDASAAFAEQQAAQAEDGLQDRQADVFEFVREQWESRRQRTTSSQVADALSFRGDTASRKARRTLEQLCRKCLLQNSKEVTSNGQVVWYWPAEAKDEDIDGPSPSQPSEVSPAPPPSLTANELNTESSDTPREGTHRTERIEGIGGRDCRIRPPASLEARIPWLVNGEPGWTRKVGLMRGPSVFVIHADGRQLAAGRDQITDLPLAS
jgi:hypothetical protein